VRVRSLDGGWNLSALVGEIVFEVEKTVQFYRNAACLTGHLRADTVMNLDKGRLEFLYLRLAMLLAVLLAIVLSFKNKALPAKHVGFTHAIVPKANKPKQKIEGPEIFAVKRVEQEVEYCRGS